MFPARFLQLFPGLLCLFRSWSWDAGAEAFRTDPCCRPQTAAYFQFFLYLVHSYRTLYYMMYENTNEELVFAYENML